MRYVEHDDATVTMQFTHGELATILTALHEIEFVPTNFDPNHIGQKAKVLELDLYNVLRHIV